MIIHTLIGIAQLNNSVLKHLCLRIREIEILVKNSNIGILLRKDPSKDILCQCNCHDPRNKQKNCKHCNDGYICISAFLFVLCCIACSAVLVIVAIFFIIYIKICINNVSQIIRYDASMRVPVQPYIQPHIQACDSQNIEHVEIEMPNQQIQRIIETNQDCSICLDNKANVLTTCRHVVMCEGCYRQIMESSKKCPICNQQILGKDTIILK